MGVRAFPNFMIIVPDPRYFAEKVKADLAPILPVHIRTKAAHTRFQSRIRHHVLLLRLLQFFQLGINKNRTNYSDCNAFIPCYAGILRTLTRYG